MPASGASRLFSVILACAAVGACATVPAAPPATVAAAVSAPVDTRMGWILRLEQQRILREPDAPVPEPVTVAPVTVERAARFKVAAGPDLAALVLDPENLVRSRAVMAIGRVGMVEGVPLLQDALQDPVPEVRAAAAFALGLLRSKESAGALQGMLNDPSLLVRGRAVEGLGLIGERSAVPWIVQAATGCAARLAPITADDLEWPKSDEIELCRLSLYALTTLASYEGVATVALDAQGELTTRWWPVAYALQRVGDPRAAAPLRAMATTPGIYSAGFALRGLTALKDAESLPLARRIVSTTDVDVKVRVAAVRLIAQVGGAEDVPVLIKMLTGLRGAEPLAIEIVTALGTLAQPAAFDVLVDLLSDPAPAMRAAALGAAAKANPDGFLIVLAGRNLDSDWTVRAALAHVLATLPEERGRAGILDLTADEDPRVHGPALEALAAVKAPELGARLAAAIAAADFVERATAARLIGESRLEGGAAMLAAAYDRGESDTAFSARAEALAAIAKFGGEAAIATLRRALADRDWPVRVRAASLLRELGVADAAPVRPGPVRWSAAFLESPALLHPAYSPHAFIETRHGAIEVQLDVVNAPLTSATFVELARSGFFNGMKVHRLVPAFVIQTGDPRGDGAGGPGYTIRDELSAVPFLRGTLGLALDWADTGGSQWFITTSPQPHLDARYTAFGRVVNGEEMLDRVSAGDVIEQVRIWDGVEFK